MKKVIYSFLFSGVFMVCACNHPGTTSQKGGRLTYSAFLQHFPVIGLPFQYTEDSLARSFPDSLQLDARKMAPYIPDSLWHPDGKHGRTGKVFPIGQLRDGGLHLVLVKINGASSTSVNLLVYGKADTLLSVKQVASVHRKTPGHVFTFDLDDNYLVHIKERKALGNGHVITREQVYGTNSNGSLPLILTNTNEPASANSYYNPIDTLPAKDRFSGDYTVGKFDIVSVRDGDKKGTFRFFIHLNKGNGDCTGELDGMGKFTGKSTGEFHEDDGPCAIRFTFSSNRVTIEETGGCGAYRGVSCYFNGTYHKKKSDSKKK
jgi:hypothetical protein